MIVKFNNNRTLVVSWKHKMKGSKNWTECAVRTGNQNDDILLVHVKAHRHENDEFSKNKGRKVSLNRALQSLSNEPVQGFQPLTREERTAVWGKYVEMRNGKI